MMSQNRFSESKDYTSYMPSCKKFLGAEMCTCITMRVITGDYCSKSDSRELVRSFALRVDEAIRTER